jgi:hypothetical protein
MNSAGAPQPQRGCPYSRWKEGSGTLLSFGLSTGALLACSAVIGLRDATVGADTAGYIRVFESLPHRPYASLGSADYQDTSFYVLSKLLIEMVGVRGALVFFAFVLVAALVFVAHAFGGRRAWLVLCLYLSLPAFYAAGMNVMRLGTAMAALLCAAGLFRLGRHVLGGFALICALLIHWTALLPIVGAGVAAVLSLRGALIGFVALTAAAYGGAQIDQILAYLVGHGIPGLEFARLGTYLRYADEWGYDTGFRYDFLVYSVFPLLCAVFCRWHLVTDSKSSRSSAVYVMKLYAVLCGLFVLAFPYPYSDRVGMFVWFSIPLLFAADAGRRSSVASVAEALGIMGILAGNVYLVLTAWM